MADQPAVPEKYEQLGKARLSLVDAVAQSVGFMGPVFVSALILPLIVAAGAAGKGAGVATPFAVILAAIGIAAIGWIIALYARRIHAAGALYDYVTHGFGERVGFWAGWVYYWGTMALTAAIPLIFGGIVYGLLHDDIGWKGTPPYWVWGLIDCGVIFVLLYFGVRISTRAQLTLSLVSATVVFSFMIYIIAKGGAGGDSNSIKPFLPSSSSDGWSGIFYGILYGILTFVGFETAANLGEETADPKRSIPRAILLSILVVGVFYVIVAYAQDIGFGQNAGKWGASIATGPLFVLGAPGAFGSVFFDRLLQVIVILDITAVGIGAAVSTSRGFFAMARDRRLPGTMAKVSSRYGTPVGSILFTVGVCAVVALWTRFGHGLLTREIPGVPPNVALFPEYFPLFAWLAGYGSFALAAVYGTVAIAGIRGLWDEENKALLVIAGVVGCAVALGGLWGSIYKVVHPANKIPWAVLITLILGIILGLVVRGRAPASQVISELSEAGGGGGS
jgi:amino acid transporter